MDSLLSYLSSNNQIWAHYDTTQRAELDVSELWGESDSTSFRTVHRSLQPSEIEPWLSTPVIEGVRHQNDRCTLRMVWVSHDRFQNVDDVAAHQLAQVLKSFELETAYAYTRTAFAAAVTLQEGLFAVCIHPKITLVWRHENRSTQGIFFADPASIQDLKGMLDSQWCFAREPSFLAFLCALKLGCEIDQEQIKVKQEIREVEVRTGYHRWSVRKEARAIGDLSLLSARMSGCTTKMASATRKTQVVKQLHTLVSDGIKVCTSTLTAGAQHGADVAVSELHAATELLRSRVQMQAVDTEFVQHRISAQVTALQHLISQKDTLLSQSVAQDSRLLALASQRDSSSMKTLAVVTMFFLPGTFVASVFAMPYFIFDQNEKQVVLHRNFGIYWSVTIPLTLMTLLLWIGWATWKDWQEQRRMKDETDRLQEESMGLALPAMGRTELHNDNMGVHAGVSEIQTIARRRTMLERQKTVWRHDKLGD